MLKGMITDGTSRHRVQGTDVTVMAKVGTFAEHTCVSEASVIRVEEDLPLAAVALVSCGVATGWGSAVSRAGVTPGDTVVVVGIGGIGINAVQGARMAGAKRIVAIDPVEFKREKAMEFGATHTFPSLEEALAPIQELTWGQMCNKVIMTLGVGSGEAMAAALAITAKRGRVVVTNIHPALEIDVKASFLDLTLMEKQIHGSLFGSGNPRYDIPKLIGLYREGQLDLDGLVTRTYSLDEINQGYADMRDGKNIRGVLVYE
jgi:S-(hydroxymethyl)glutathione dehydrogenase/alcohol dehydrogenase